MTEEEIKQAVEEYFKIQFEKDSEYVDNVTDSWLYDAESWFITRTDKAPSQTEFHVFDKLVQERFKEIYDEKYGNRDAYEILLSSIQKLSPIFKDLKEKVLPHFNINHKEDAEEIEHAIRRFDRILIDAHMYHWLKPIKEENLDFYREFERRTYETTEEFINTIKDEDVRTFFREFMPQYLQYAGTKKLTKYIEQYLDKHLDEIDRRSDFYGTLVSLWSDHMQLLRYRQGKGYTAEDIFRLGVPKKIKERILSKQK